MYKLILFCSTVFSLFANQDLRSFVDGLRQDDRELLDKFLRHTIQTINGFVIYGDKPLGLFSYVNETVFWPSDYEDANVLPKGKEIWRQLNISPKDKNYALIHFNANGYCNFVAINRNAFIKVVRENLSLFRYVLGPTLTPEGLLESLLEAGDHFYDVFKNDNVLFGILLGYGTQNALLGSRLELVGRACFADQKEVFPFLPYHIRMKSQNSGVQDLIPSLGYGTLTEETEVLAQKVSSCHDKAPLLPYALPFFGCDKDSQETKILLAIYEKNQQEILKSVEDPDFLYKTLLKFLQKESGELEIPKMPSMLSCSLPNKEDASIKLADILAIHLAYQERRSRDACLQALLQGIEFQSKHAKEPIPPVGYNQNWREAIELEEELSRWEKLQDVDLYFQHLEDKPHIQCLAPRALYYKVLRKGRGEALSKKTNKISFHYSNKIQGSKKLHSFGTIQDASLDSFISGVAHALLGMKRGEERWVAIHPAFGYGNDSFFQPNAILLTRLTLIDFEETDQETEIFPLYELKPRKLETIRARYNELKAKIYQDQGRDLWRIMNRVNERIDLKLLKNAIEGILRDERECPFKTMKEAQDYSMALQDYLSAKRNPDRSSSLDLFASQDRTQTQ